MQEVRERVLALAGREVAGYRLERVLASGAADVMYLGRQVGKKPEPITRPGLPPLLLPELALIDLVPLQQRRDERAAALQRLLPQLQRLDHQSILPLLACGDDSVSGCIYAMYPYTSAGSLANRLKSAKGKPLPFPEATAYLKEIAGALDSAHQQGYYHLHLNPDTILLDSSGTAYLAGIGLAQILELQGSIAEGSLYAAPEQVIHDPALPTTDVYSLGMVLYQLVTGHTAFDSTRQQLQAPPPPTQYRRDLPAQIETVILRAISGDPAQRYTTAGLLSQDFALAIKNSKGQSKAKGIQQSVAESSKPPAVPASPVIPALAVVPAPPAAPSSKSFVYSSPRPTGNTLFPPSPQPHWDLPPQLAGQLAPTQEFSPAAEQQRRVAKAKAPSNNRKRSWGVSLVSSMIALVCVAILAVLVFSLLNHQISLPALSVPGHSSASTGAAVGSNNYTASAGASLYMAISPGTCDKGGASWAANSEVDQICGANNMLMSAASCQDCSLAVVTFAKLPGQATYPTNFAATVMVQPLATDPTVLFGLKFRQQSVQDDGQQRGGYSFLVSQNGQWEFDKYAPDGSRQQLAQGKLSTTLPPNSTVGLVVQGSKYYFYVNGKKVATEADSTYSGGYLCLVAAPSATILFSQFSLSRLR